MTREEHLRWCKDRALEYVDLNDLDQAMASMMSDLGKHEGTMNHAAGPLMLAMATSGLLSTASEMRKFIKDFN